MCLPLMLGVLLCAVHVHCVRGQSLGECTEQVLSAPTENSVRVRLTGVNQWPTNPICLWTASGVRSDGATYLWRAALVGDGLVDGPSVNTVVVFNYEINGSIAKRVAQGFLFPYPSGPFTVVVNESDPDTSQGYPAMAIQGRITLDAANNLTVDVTFTGGDLPPQPSIADLIALVDDSNLSQRRKHPLLATLEAASDSLASGDCDTAITQLQAFQNKVQAQVRRTDATLADALIADAQAIIDSACDE